MLAAENGRQLVGVTEAQAGALAELFKGRHSLLEAPRPLTIVELCRFYTQHSSSASWHPLCNMWNRALQVGPRTHCRADGCDTSRSLGCCCP